MKLRGLLLGSAIALGSAGAANAAITTPEGWYLSLGAGANWVEDGNVTEVDISGGTVVNVFSYDDGWAVISAVGYDYGRWRVEFELAYRDNDVDNFSSGGGPSSAPGADLWELSQMINVLYDIGLGGRWSASVGAGIGGNLVVFTPDTAGNFDPTAAGLEADDYVLAGQLIAQAAYQLAERWQLYLDYRFMFMDDPELQDPGEVDEIFQMEKTDHTVIVGFRFDLQGEAAPAPAPKEEAPPAPSAPKQFIVFFGFNKANLTEEAARVVADAAAAAKEYGSASIIVVGHTDTVGSAQYNNRLSIRRSQAVKDGLVANGIPASAISTSGRGEAELMVQTGDGVKEPQNRRATIDLQ